MLHNILELKKEYGIKDTDDDTIVELRVLELNAYIATLLPDPCFTVYINEDAFITPEDVTKVEFIKRINRSLCESKYMTEISKGLSDKGADWLMSTDFKK